MAVDDPLVELRGNCPRDVVDVIDAVSQSKRISRMEQVNAILARWADEKRREAELIQRVTRITSGSSR